MTEIRCESVLASSAGSDFARSAEADLNPVISARGPSGRSLLKSGRVRGRGDRYATDEQDQGCEKGEHAAVGLSIDHLSLSQKMA